MEGALDEALAQTLPRERPGSRFSHNTSNRTSMKPSMKTSNVTRRMSSVEVNLQQESRDFGESSKSKSSNKGSGPPLEVGPTSMKEPERPSTGNQPKRRMTTANVSPPQVQSQSASPDVYDALVSAVKDASGSKKDKRSLKSVASTVKMTRRYSGKP